MPRSCSRPRARVLPPPPADAAPLPPAPAHRARGARPHRDERHRRLGAWPAPLHRADLRARRCRCPTGTEPVSLERASRACRTPTASGAPRRPRRVTASLRPGLRTRAFVFNTLLQDKATKDRLRDYPHWLASRNLANEASDESVQALVDGGAAALRPPRRWYALKARLLGLDRLADYDRMAPVRQRRPHRATARPSEIVLDCYRTFSPELGAAAARVLHGRLHRRPAAPGQARRRVLLVHRAVGAPVRDAQLHVAPARRADDGARARPRRARRRSRARRGSSTSPRR